MTDPTPDPTPTDLPMEASPQEQAAITAVYDAEHDWLTASNSDFDEQSRVLAMLRAVPLDYCVQRAINERALIDTGKKVVSHREVLGRGKWINHFTPLYRLASKNETNG